MKNLQIVPRLIDDCLQKIVAPLLTSRRISKDVNGIFRHYRVTISRLDAESLMSLCYDCLAVYGYKVNDRSQGIEESIEISISIPPGLKIRGTAIVHKLKTAPSQVVLQINTQSDTHPQRSLTAEDLAKTLSILTLPSYLTEFFHTVQAFPDLKQRLDREARTRFNIPNGDYDFLIGAGYKLIAA